MQELLAFQTFPSVEDANSVACKLNEAGILTEVVPTPRRLDAPIIGNEYSDKFILRIASDDFIKANELLINAAQIDANEIESTHPLLKLDNDELKDIVAKPDEWGPDNYNIALALLKSRGIALTGTTLTQMEAARIQALSEPKSMHPLILFMGYMAGLWHVVALVLIYEKVLAPKYVWCFPGVFGLLLGAIIIQSKTTLPNGKRVVTFDNKTLKHGIIILGLSVLAWVVNIIVFLFVFA